MLEHIIKAKKNSFDINVKDRSGFTPLLHACFNYDCLDVLKAVLSLNPDMNMLYPGSTPGSPHLFLEAHLKTEYKDNAMVYMGPSLDILKHYRDEMGIKKEKERLEKQISLNSLSLASPSKPIKI